MTYFEKLGLLSEFLRKHGLTTFDYFQAYKRAKFFNYMPFYKQVKRFKPCQLLESLFLWKETKQGVLFWGDLHKEWLAFLYKRGKLC